jgi:hypothetical protein
MNDLLSLWRSPLDKVAVAEAHALSERQPRCTIVYAEDFSPMTVYNFGHYDATLISPDVALGAMFSQMNPSSLGNTGALAFIPQKQYLVTSSASGFTVPDQSNIVGSGGGGTPIAGSGSFFHFLINPSTTTPTIFFNCSSSDYTSGGVYFRSLAFQWGLSSYPTDTCIEAAMWNVRAIRCTFTDCPIAFNATGVSCALEQCTINYTVSSETGQNGTEAVILAGSQCSVRGPGNFSQTSPATGGATGCTCISVQGSDHAVIADMKLYEWTIGVDFSKAAGASSCEILNCEFECWQTAVKIGLPSSGGTTSGIKITSCTLAKASDSTDSSPIVSISAGTGTLSDVTLLDCTVYNMAEAPGGQCGLVIASGNNIKIIGGTYSSNGPSGGAGIAITGAATNIQIIGANLQPSYGSSSNVQQYALSITGGPTNVLVSSCDMTGYSAGHAVSVGAGATTLRIINCPGYNDINTHLTATPAQLTSNVSASIATNPYYGPSVIMYASTVPVTLHLFGQVISATYGVYFLPYATDNFHFSAMPNIFFTWIGK